MVLFRFECVVMMIMGRLGKLFWICVSKLRLLVLGMCILVMIIFGWVLCSLLSVEFLELKVEVWMFFCVSVFLRI